MWLDSSTMIHTIHTTSTTMIAAANVENKVSITEQLGYRTPQQNSEDEDEGAHNVQVYSDVLRRHRRACRSRR